MRGSWAGTGLRLQSPVVALRSQQCQLLKEGEERLGVQKKGSMKPFFPRGVTSSSATEVLVGRNQSWQAESWKRTGNWCCYPQSPPCWSSGSHGNAAKPPCSRKICRRTRVRPGDVHETVVPNPSSCRSRTPEPLTATGLRKRRLSKAELCPQHIGRKERCSWV